MLKKISLTAIVHDHQKTLSVKRNDSIDVKNILIFFGIPAIFGFTLMDLNIKDSSSSLITILAIFSGLLFNLLATLFGIAEKTDRSNFPNRYNFLKAVIANVGYTVFIAIVNTAFFALISFDFYKIFFLFDFLGAKRIPEIFQRFTNFYTIFLLGHFMLCLLLVISRFYDLIVSELKS